MRMVYALSENGPMDMFDLRNRFEVLILRRGIRIGNVYQYRQR
jgi:hypothetical protein